MSLIETQPRRHPFWPAAVITIGISLTVSWVLLVGYGLLKLVESVV